MPRAFVTGIGGQDGSYLAEQLIKKGYEVHGLIMRSATFDRQNIDHIKGLKLHYGDVTDIVSLIKVLEEVKPDEVYNLAAQSDVEISWKYPYYTTEATGLGVLNLLEAIRVLKLNPKIYQASL